ncbi:18225_t:CDS:1, partial [Gigaspora margarita]
TKNGKYRRHPIQQVQPSTLNTIRRFVTEWNQDPVSQTSNLLIMGTQVFMTSGDNTIPLSLPVEESLATYNDIPLFEDIEILNNAMPLLLLTEESLVTYDDLSLFEDSEILAPVTENPNQIDHSVDSEKDYFCQIRNDLLVQSNSIPF